MAHPLVNAAFVPPRGWRSGHLQTMRSRALPSHFDLQQVGQQRQHWVETLDGTGDRISVQIHRSKRPRSQPPIPLLVLIHGLGGSAESDYVRNAAHGLLQLGFHIARVDLRGAGLSREHSTLLYHAGRTDDLRLILRDLAAQPEAQRSFAAPALGLVGFSLGGNMTIKMTGEPLDGIPLAAAATVSSPLNLTVGAPHLEQAAWGIYEKFLLRGLRSDTLAPGDDGRLRVTESESALVKSARSLAAFDDALTAPRNGWRDSAEYYAVNSSDQYLPSVRRPLLVIHSLDDPMIPAAPYLSVDWDQLRGIGYVRPLLTNVGGHVGFHERGRKYRWFVPVLGRFFAESPA